MDPSNLTTLTYVALAVAVVSFVLAIAAHRRLARARRSLSILQGTFEGKTILDAVASYVGEVRTIEDDLLALTRRTEELFAMLGRSKRNLGLVRYDAFEDMGGKLSFSAALLDDHGSGVVITSINGRSESRAYAKPVANGDSDHNLSDEEQRAIAAALDRGAKVRR